MSILRFFYVLKKGLVYEHAYLNLKMSFLSTPKQHFKPPIIYNYTYLNKTFLKLYA